jgi:hypothetical protein
MLESKEDSKHIFLLFFNVSFGLRFIQNWRYLEYETKT